MSLFLPSRRRQMDTLDRATLEAMRWMEITGGSGPPRRGRGRLPRCEHLRPEQSGRALLRTARTPPSSANAPAQAQPDAASDRAETATRNDNHTVGDFQPASVLTAPATTAITKATDRTRTQPTTPVGCRAAQWPRWRWLPRSKRSRCSSSRPWRPVGSCGACARAPLAVRRGLSVGLRANNRRIAERHRPVAPDPGGAAGSQIEHYVVAGL